MFDFMRRKKDMQSEMDAPPAKSKDKQRLRRASLMSPVRPRASKKRDRPMSGSFIPGNVPSQESITVRPPCPRADSSSRSASSFDFRNPFLDDGEPSISGSQLDLTQPVGSSSSELPTTHIRQVVRGSPTIVHPPSEFAEVFYPVEMGAPKMVDPFADEVPSIRCHSEPGEDEVLEEGAMIKKASTRRRRRSSATAVCRKPADYLHVNIPVTMFSPPIGVARQEIWARV
ncbi:uncharacterized protein B0H18DRAFT_978767 [Fomitopsis serialis]|uniref:uncharacterized protein n=1 Tax=Fomitopsis serialis TaxID=139415 RepID=UPI002007F8DE|nr:uncharacterized protein B0H18DRAFT_978767 [Neoantrodia serialis]KAH9934880.1 hypothetical protein B0H18DRAFT_978767 [Neoantrodia serialis]